MVWTKQSKIRFYWERRRQAVKKYTDAAKTLGTSTKSARKKAMRELTKEYRSRRDNLRKVNSIEKQIKKLLKKDEISKQETRKLKSLQNKQSKLVIKTHEKWNKYELKIEYTTHAEKDMEQVTKAKT